MLTFLRSPILYIVLVVSLTLAVALAAAVGLTLAKFSRSLTTAVDARYEIHAADVRSSIETGISLGLSLDEIRNNVETIVSSRIAVDPGILRIAISDARGAEILSIGSGREIIDDQEVGLQTQPLENTFGAVVGEVEIAYAISQNRAAIIDAARILGMNAAILSAAAAALIALTCLVVMTSIPRSLKRALSVLKDDANCSRVRANPGGQIEQDAVKAADTVKAVLGELDQLEAELPTGAS